MKITVAGTGYVGLSLAVLLAQHNEVIALDVISEKIDLINDKKSPIVDDYISKYLVEKPLDLTATLDYKAALENADYVIVSTPTNYDSEENYFDTTSVDDILEKVTKINPNAVVIIKSTIPVGFTEEARQRFSNSNIIFAPEFLREGKALYDNLYPSRIIVGEDSERGHVFVGLLQEAAIEEMD